MKGDTPEMTEARERAVTKVNEMYSRSNDDLFLCRFVDYLDARRTMPGDAEELRRVAKNLYAHLLEVAKIMEEAGIG